MEGGLSRRQAFKIIAIAASGAFVAACTRRELPSPTQPPEVPVGGGGEPNPDALTALAETSNPATQRAVETRAAEVAQTQTAEAVIPDWEAGEARRLEEVASQFTTPPGRIEYSEGRSVATIPVTVAVDRSLANVGPFLPPNELAGVSWLGIESIEPANGDFQATADKIASAYIYACWVATNNRLRERGQPEITLEDYLRDPRPVNVIGINLTQEQEQTVNSLLLPDQGYEVSIDPSKPLEIVLAAEGQYGVGTINKEDIYPATAGVRADGSARIVIFYNLTRVTMGRGFNAFEFGHSLAVTLWALTNSIDRQLDEGSLRGGGLTSGHLERVLENAVVTENTPNNR